MTTTTTAAAVVTKSKEMGVISQHDLVWCIACTRKNAGQISVSAWPRVFVLGVSKCCWEGKFATRCSVAATRAGPTRRNVGLTECEKLKRGNRILWAHNNGSQDVRSGTEFPQSLTLT